MKDFVQIPLEEYELMKEEISLLKDTALLSKMNRLVDILFEEKYGLYLGNNTSDLTEISVQRSWSQEKSAWDDV